MNRDQIINAISTLRQQTAALEEQAIGLSSRTAAGESTAAPLDPGLPASMPDLVADLAPVSWHAWLAELDRQTSAAGMTPVGFAGPPMAPVITDGRMGPYAMLRAPLANPAPRSLAVLDLDAESGALPPLVAGFVKSVDQASLQFAAALLNEPDERFRLPKTYRKAEYRSWYEELVEGAIRRAAALREAIVFDWKPDSAGEKAADRALLILASTMPSMTSVGLFIERDRKAALKALAKNLDLVAQQVRVLCGLQAELHAGPDDTEAVSNDETRFAEISEDLLARAGGGMSLTAAARMVGSSRQALHKRIRKGTVLGLMRNGELVVPLAQWTRKDGKPVVLPGIADVIDAFSVAGGWSALQFLVEADPNLGRTPLLALAEGKVADVVHAARAYLGDDEE